MGDHNLVQWVALRGLQQASSLRPRAQQKQVAVLLDVVVVKSKDRYYYQKGIMNETAKLAFVTYVVKTSI